MDGGTLPDLRVDGYTGTRLAAVLLMSADTRRDRLRLTADDPTITADGSDVTRVAIRATGAYGNHRPNMTGEVTLTLTGPAVLIGQNPFPFGSYGGVGGAFIRPAEPAACWVSPRFAAKALRIGDEGPWRGPGGRRRLMAWALPTYEEDAVVIPSADDSLPSQGTRAGRWSPQPRR